MSDGTVDNLNIQISAEAKSAEKSLNSLSSTLLKVNKNLQSSVGVIRKVSKEVGTLQSAVKSFSNIGKINMNSSGIGKTMNSLKRLLSVDTKNFDINGFKNITGAIRQIGNMPDVSNNVNRFVSALARLANAGSKTGQTANSIKKLGEQTRLAAKELKGIGNISNELNMFVQSIGRLASAGNKTGQTASSLRNLAKETLEFFNVMSKAPRISKNTIAMTQALAQLANAGGRVSTATNTISTAFNKLSSVGGKTLNAMKKVASGIVSAFKNISTSGKHIDSARFSLWNLAKTAIGVRLGYGVYEFAREAINLGSAITEVENVVDVSFGSMADKAYEFASTAKEQFGLSELAAKQYSGTMMAMLNASGVARDAAAEMSIGLAGLAGDLASFYNISTDEAFYKLRSAIAGEVEPMRQLGVSMTVANLQAYALSQGITKSWQSMTQAEQAMLRYNYIMSVTGAQQGDYARTVNTFANQWRLLTLNVQQFSATVGQGVIAAVLPAIQALNALFSVLQKAAQAFRDFMYVLTGYKGQGSQGGVVNDLGGIGDMSSDIGDVSSGLGDLGSAGDTASGGLDEATNSAEELKKALSVLSFDDLNQLSDSSTPNLSTPSTGGAGTGGIGSGGGSGLGGLGGSGIGGLDSLTDALGKSNLPEAVNEWAERIRDAFLDHDWDRLGEEIAWGINKGMQALYDAINWKNVGPKISKFTNAFTKTFNSLVDHIDWDLMGRTVGAGINTIVNTLNRLADGIDWKNLGRKIAYGFNGLFDEVDWYNLGHLIGNKFRIAWDLFGGFVMNLDYEAIGKDVANGLNGVFATISFSDIASYLATALNGAFTILGEFARNFEWDDLVNNIVNGINSFIARFRWEDNGKNLNEFLENLLDSLKSIAAGIHWEEFGEGIGTFLSQIDWSDILFTVINTIITVLGGLFDGLEESGTAGKIAAFLGKAFLAVKIANITGIGTLVKKIAIKIAEHFQTESIIKQIGDAIGQAMSGGATKASQSLDDLGGKIGNTGGKLGGLKGVLSSTVGSLGLFLTATTLGGIGLAKLGDSARGGNGDLTELGGVMDNISNNFSPELQEKIFSLKESLEDSGASTSEFKTAFTDLFSQAGVSAETLQAAYDGLNGKIQLTGEQQELLRGIIDGVAESVENSSAKVEESGLKTSDAFNLIRDSMGELVQKGEILNNEQLPILRNSLDQMQDSGLNAEQALDQISQEMEGMGIDSEAFRNYVEQNINGSLDSAGEKAKDFDSNLSNSLDNIAINAKTKSETIGNNIGEGLAQGTEKSEEKVKKSNESLIEKIKNWWKDAFGIHSPSTYMESIGGYMMDGLENGIDDNSNKPKNKLETLGDALKESMDSTLKNMERNTNSSIESIERSFDSAQRSANDSAWNIKSAFSNLHIPLPHLDWDWNTVNFGNFSLSIPSFSIRWYAKGGLFTKATLAGIGEAGKEAVLPLENRRTMSMIADSIMESGNIGVDEETLANAVAQGVAMAMMNNQENLKPNVTVYAELKTENDEVLARAVTRGQQKIDYRNNPTIRFGY